MTGLTPFAAISTFSTEYFLGAFLTGFTKSDGAKEFQSSLISLFFLDAEGDFFDAGGFHDVDDLGEFFERDALVGLKNRRGFRFLSHDF